MRTSSYPLEPVSVRGVLPTMEVRGTRAWMKKGQSGRLTGILEREAFIRKVPVRRVQGAGQEDGRAEGGQERTAKQLRCYAGMVHERVSHERSMLHVYIKAARITKTSNPSFGAN